MTKIDFDKAKCILCFFFLFFLISCTNSLEKPKVSKEIVLEPIKIEPTEKFPDASIDQFEGSWVIKDFLDSLSLNREYSFGVFKNYTFFIFRIYNFNQDTSS